MKYNFVVGVNTEVTLDKSIVVAVLAMRKFFNSIESIKLIRSTVKVGLREAKDLSEFIEDNFMFGDGGELLIKRTIPIVRYLGTTE